MFEFQRFAVNFVDGLSQAMVSVVQELMQGLSEH